MASQQAATDPHFYDQQTGQTPAHQGLIKPRGPAPLLNPTQAQPPAQPPAQPHTQPQSHPHTHQKPLPPSLNPSSTFNTQSVLITGASSGCGAAIALSLAAAGASTVFIHFNSNEAGAHAVAEKIHALRANHADGPCSVNLLKADLSATKGVESLIKIVLELTQGKGVDVLVSNAGVAPRMVDGDWTKVSVEVFTQTWQTNTVPTFLLAQTFIPLMASRHYGRFIINSSIAAFNGGKVGPHYASSKGALNSLVHSLASIYANQGVTVNAVAPALIEGTAMLPSGRNAELQKWIPVGRLGQTEEVAGTVRWMCETGYITSKIVLVDGGRLAY